MEDSADCSPLTGEVGYQPSRDFDFYRAEVRYHQDGGAPVRNDYVPRGVLTVASSVAAGRDYPNKPRPQ